MYRFFNIFGYWVPYPACLPMLGAKGRGSAVLAVLRVNRDSGLEEMTMTMMARSFLLLVVAFLLVMAFSKGVTYAQYSSFAACERRCSGTCETGRVIYCEE
ncbi:hypothetical protein JTB14_017614 [Gonioctena quinquepunctata]|nr:hypothetical protein JTB14_017614 [Gonioctena quinquepunctata]